MRTATAVWKVKLASDDRAAMARDIYRDLMVSLAGTAAPQLAGYPDEPAEDWDNICDCAYILARLEAGRPAMPGRGERRVLRPLTPLHAAAVGIIEHARAETVAILQDNWPAVVRVAGVLAKRDRLTQAELDHIIANRRRLASRLRW